MKKLLSLLVLPFLLAGCASSASQPSQPVGPVVVAILDTGISDQAIDRASLLPGHNYVTGTDDTQDRINHGTAAASVIVGCASAGVEGLAPDALLVPLVVSDLVDGEQESVSPEVLAQAIRDGVDTYGADVLNVSLGIKTDNEEVRAAVKYAEKQGVLVVAAVGNSGDREDLYYPAAYDTVLAVGSHSRGGEVSAFSQQNGTADILAPGEGIWLASRSGATYGAKGTSYAAAYVSGSAAAILAQKPDLTPAKLRTLLETTADDLGDPGKDKESGWGILNLDRALEEVTGAQN